MSAEERLVRVEDGLVPLKSSELARWGLSRTAAYEEIAAGLLDVVKVKGRRFVPVRALKERAARGLVPATASA